MENIRKSKPPDPNEKPVEQELCEKRKKYWKRLSEIVWELPTKDVKKSRSSS